METGAVNMLITAFLKEWLLLHTKHSFNLTVAGDLSVIIAWFSPPYLIPVWCKRCTESNTKAEVTATALNSGRRLCLYYLPTSLWWNTNEQKNSTVFILCVTKNHSHYPYIILFSSFHHSSCLVLTILFHLNTWTPEDIL